MLCVYFSGTGNTRYCAQQFVRHFKGGRAVSIEEPDVLYAIKQADSLAFAYPTYYSNLPKIVCDFLKANAGAFAGKKVFVICTMGLMSGDGAGMVARLLKKHGATIIGGQHVKMPDCIGDVKLLKKPLDKNRRIVQSAKLKIARAAEALKQGKPPQTGLTIFSHALGLFGQRLWFAGHVKEYKDTLKINKAACSGCGKCASLCPMKDLRLSDGKAVSGGQCTLCYRCVSHCPKQAITLIGSKVVEQSLIEKYL